MAKKVLYIEDNEQNLYLVRYILEKAGYDVSEEKDGNRGIESAERINPDLILLDIQLPGMDGYHVAEAIRKNPGLKAVPIVAITSYAMPGDRERVLKAGCTGYMEKPINPDTFLKQVSEYLIKRNQGAENERNIDRR